MSTERSLSILRIVEGIVVGWYSALLIFHQLHGRMHLPLLILGAVELIAAILFLAPQTLRVGGIALIVVFVAAAGFHILHDEYDVGYLIIYGAAAFTVVANEKRA